MVEYLLTMNLKTPFHLSHSPVYSAAHQSLPAGSSSQDVVIQASLALLLVEFEKRAFKSFAYSELDDAPPCHLLLFV